MYVSKAGSELSKYKLYSTKSIKMYPIRVAGVFDNFLWIWINFTCLSLFYRQSKGLSLSTPTQNSNVFYPIAAVLDASLIGIELSRRKLVLLIALAPYKYCSVGNIICMQCFHCSHYLCLHPILDYAIWIKLN